LKEKLKAKEALENKHKLNFKEEQKALMSSMGGDSNDNDELKIIRVNDVDIKSVVNELEGSEDEDLEDEKSYDSKKKHNKKQN